MSVRRTYLNLMRPFSGREMSLTVYAYDEISKSGVDNFVFSPFAAETILALTYLGAGEETADQLRFALAYKSSAKDQIENCYKKVLKTLQEQAPAVVMHNFVFVTNKYELKEEYKKTCVSFDTLLQPVDFNNPPEATKTINLHVTNTGEDLDDLVEFCHISDKTRMILATFTKFKGFWNSAFDPNLNLYVHFIERPNKPPVSVPAMLKFWFFHYYNHPTLDCRFVEMYFLGRDISLTIALPNKIDGLAALENQIDLVVRADHPLKKHHVLLHFPKFKIESTVDYKEILKKLCVEKAFKSGADFGNIAGNSDLCIDDIIQKAVVDFAETGCNTNGLTSPIDGTDLSEYDNYDTSKVDVKVDHPFIFYIRVKDLIVYVGRVVSLEGDELLESSFEIE